MPEFLHVNNEDTLKKMNNNSKDKFVKYYMDGCGHCDDLEPIWKLVESRINKEHQNSNVTIVQINANFMDNANIPNVEGFPTISMIKGGKKMDHNGARTEEAIMSFFKKHNLLTTQGGGGGGKRRSTRKRSKYCKNKSKNMICVRGNKKKLKRLAKYSKKNKMKLTRCSKKRLRSKNTRKKSKKKQVRKNKKSNIAGENWLTRTINKFRPVTKVSPVYLGTSEVNRKYADEHHIKELEKEGREIIERINNPPTPFYHPRNDEKRFDTLKKEYDSFITSYPKLQVVEKGIPIKNSNMPTTTLVFDGTAKNNDLAVIRESRSRLPFMRSIRSNRILPTTGGKRKKRRSRRWSKKYKKGINCKNPRGFSQKQYCKYR